MLKVSHLSKRFGAIEALRDCSFDVERGHIVGFVGPNGSGKTTMMRAILGLTEPDDGEILWHGRPITFEDRRRIGYLPEERGLYPRMPIHQQLVHFAQLSGMPGADAERRATLWLRRLGLQDRSESELQALSHGNQQRVQLAAASVHDPELAIYDEPFAGLDPAGVESLSEVVRERVDEGRAVLFSSHQLDLVEDLCTDVVLIGSGEIVMAGSLAGLRASSGRRTLDVSVDGSRWIPEIDAVTVERVNGDERVLLEGSADVGRVLAMAREEGDVTTFRFGPPRLSDLFHDAVEGQSSSETFDERNGSEKVDAS